MSSISRLTDQNTHIRVCVWSLLKCCRAHTPSEWFFWLVHTGGQGEAFNYVWLNCSCLASRMTIRLNNRTIRALSGADGNTTWYLLNAPPSTGAQAAKLSVCQWVFLSHPFICNSSAWTVSIIVEICFGTTAPLISRMLRRQTVAQEQPGVKWDGLRADLINDGSIRVTCPRRK